MIKPRQILVRFTRENFGLEQQPVAAQQMLKD
jgi:hypothetical protein